MSRARLRTPEQERAAFGFLTTEAVAERLNVSRTQVSALIRSKALPAYNVGVGARPEYRVDPAALEAFLAERLVA